MFSGEGCEAELLLWNSRRRHLNKDLKKSMDILSGCDGKHCFQWLEYYKDPRWNTHSLLDEQPGRRVSGESGEGGGQRDGSRVANPASLTHHCKGLGMYSEAYRA